MNFLALPFGQPLPSEREGGTLRFRAVLHGYDPQGARFSVRCRGAVAAENCNFHRDEPGFVFGALVKACKQSSCCLSKAFQSFRSVVVHVGNSIGRMRQSAVKA